METEIKQEDVGEDKVFQSRETSDTSSNTQRTRKYSGKKPAEEDDFFVVKTEDEDVQISSEVKPEEEYGDGSARLQGTSPGGNPGHIASDADMMGALDVPRERFFHNGKELDLGDMLTTMAGTSVPNGQQRSTDILVEEDKLGEEDTEEEEEEDMEDEAEEEEDDNKDTEHEESCGEEKNVRKPKPSSSSDNQTQEENVAAVPRTYLTDSQKEIVERLVESNINVFRTITSSVEQREKKMSLWRTIAREVNCVPSRREITPEELVTLWSKHLFEKHVYSRKSMTSKSDNRGNVGATQVFKTLISKRGEPQKDKKSLVPCLQNGPANKSCDLSEEEEQVYDEQIAKFKKVFTDWHHVCDEQRAVKLREVWSEITTKVNEVNKGRRRTVGDLQRRLTMSLIKQKKSQSVGEQVHVGNKSRETSKTTDTSQPPEDLPIKIEIDNAESEQSEIIQVIRSRDTETETGSTVSIPQGHLPHRGTGAVGKEMLGILSVRSNSDSSGEETVTVKEEPLDDSISQPVTSHLQTDNKGSKGWELTVQDMAYIEEQVKIHKTLFLDSSQEATVGHAKAGVLKAITSALNTKHNTSYTYERVTAVASDFINKLSLIHKRLHPADRDGTPKKTRLEGSSDVSNLQITMSFPESESEETQCLQFKMGEGRLCSGQAQMKLMKSSSALVPVIVSK